jgi:hypothetical protein
MHPCMSDGPEPDPEAYPGFLKARFKGADFWAGKGLPREQIERVTGDVNRKEAI